MALTKCSRCGSELSPGGRCLACDVVASQSPFSSGERPLTPQPQPIADDGVKAPEGIVDAKAPVRRAHGRKPRSGAGAKRSRLLVGGVTLGAIVVVIASGLAIRSCSGSVTKDVAAHVKKLDGLGAVPVPARLLGRLPVANTGQCLSSNESLRYLVCVDTGCRLAGTDEMIRWGKDFETMLAGHLGEHPAQGTKSCGMVFLVMGKDTARDHYFSVLTVLEKKKCDPRIVFEYAGSFPKSPSMSPTTAKVFAEAMKDKTKPLELRRGKFLSAIREKCLALKYMQDMNLELTTNKDGKHEVQRHLEILRDRKYGARMNELGCALSRADKVAAFRQAIYGDHADRNTVYCWRGLRFRDSPRAISLGPTQAPWGTLSSQVADVAGEDAVDVWLK